MLRPIDTQILYPQTPELAARQQIANQQANIHQNQFAEHMQKEVQHKQEKVNKTPEKQKVENQLERHPSHPKKQKKKEKDDEEKSKKTQDKNTTLSNQLEAKIDIRI